jgi:hypothetical protein
MEPGIYTLAKSHRTTFTFKLIGMLSLIVADAGN